jgi:uncharacterized protein YjaZ
MREESETLLDRMVLEGLAEHFVQIKLGEVYLGPYKDALSENQARELWNSIYLPHLQDKGEKTDLFMFGNAKKGLPFWGGYSMEYYLVKWFFEKNENVSIEELTLLNSDRFLV